MELEKKIGNLTAQKHHLKLEISDLEDGLLEREELLNNIDGAIQFANSLKEDTKPKKKEKKDA